MSILKLLAGDKSLITYRKELNSITGGVTSTILLQQLIYWDNAHNGKPFYKFIEPCNNEKYTRGDSWTEELGFSKKEFAGAYKKLDNLGIVSKKTNMSRVTFYTLNTELLHTILDELYTDTKGNLDKSQKVTPISDKRELMEVTKGNLDYSTTMLHTETTTETTTEKSVATNVANHLLNKIIAYKSNFKKPTSLKVWSEDIEKAMRLDLRTEKELMNCIDWAYSNDFWAGKIMSGKKLREKFDTMESQMMKNKRNSKTKIVDELSDRGLSATELIAEAVAREEAEAKAKQGKLNG